MIGAFALTIIVTSLTSGQTLSEPPRQNTYWSQAACESAGSSISSRLTQGAAHYELRIKAGYRCDPIRKD